MLRAGLWVRTSVRRKSRTLLIGNRCNLVWICPMGNARNFGSLRHLTLTITKFVLTYFRTFWMSQILLHLLLHLLHNTLRAIFVLFQFRAIYFECLDLPASFSVWRHIFRISRSPSSFKVMGVNLKVTVAKQRQRAGLFSPRTQFNHSWNSSHAVVGDYSSLTFLSNFILEVFHCRKQKSVIQRENHNTSFCFWCVDMYVDEKFIVVNNL